MIYLSVIASNVSAILLVQFVRCLNRPMVSTERDLSNISMARLYLPCRVIPNISTGTAINIWVIIPHLVTSN